MSQLYGKSHKCDLVCYANCMLMMGTCFLIENNPELMEGLKYVHCTLAYSMRTFSVHINMQLEN